MKIRIFSHGTLIAAITILISSMSPTLLSAKEYLGAETVIQKVLSAQNELTNSGTTSSEEVREDYKADLRHYIQALYDLSPEEAARQWLSLFNRSNDLPFDDFSAHFQSFNNEVGIDVLLSYIPGPDSWPHMQRLLKTTTSTKVLQTAVLQTMLSRLQEDTAATKAGLKKVEAELAKKNQLSGYADTIKKALDGITRESVSINASVPERFQRMLELRRANTKAEAKIVVPDLVWLSDRATAQRLIREALSLPNTSLDFSASGSTLEVAQEITKNELGSMEVPRWDLVQTLGSIDLYDAMVERFPTTPEDEKSTNSQSATVIASTFGLTENQVFTGDNSNDDNGQKLAQAYHVLDLIAAGRAAEAKKYLNMETNLLQNLQSSWAKLQDRVSAKVVFNLLAEKLEQSNYTTGEHSSDAQAYEFLMNLARRQGNLEAYVKLTQAALDSGNLSTETKSQLNLNLGLTLLELDQVEDANKYLVAAATISPAETFDLQLGSHKAAAAKLITVGELLNKPEWIDTGLDLMRNLLDETIKAPSGNTVRFGYNSWRIKGLANSLLDALIKHDRSAQAEQLILEIMSRKAVQANTKNLGESLDDLLSRLVTIYAEEERYDDVLYLLTNAPWWGQDVKDASDFLNGNSFMGMPDERFFVSVAKALAATGHKQNAITLLKQYLLVSPSDDSAYDQLTTLTGSRLIPWLDKLYELDHFEERPLMWKAILLERSGQLDQAEVVAHRAVKIDPTDGEQKAGERIRSYSVLAGILEKNNKPDEAKKLRSIVESVRIAERGDALNEAGLVQQAIDSYKKSSRIFSDAYCVEWRLARRLEQTGDAAGAKVHYEKAFTMMPQQFGTMANLCFGCEAIFSNKKPQSIAERILLGKTKNPPVKPTVYYLLGTLREEQNRYLEAAEFYRTAIELNPKYYDALYALFEIREKAFLDRKEQRQIAGSLLELDPYMKHFTPSGDNILSPATLWKAAARTGESELDNNASIWPMSANKARLEEKNKENNDDQSSHIMAMERLRRRQTAPGRLLVNQEWFRPLVNIMQLISRQQMMSQF